MSHFFLVLVIAIPVMMLSVVILSSPQICIDGEDPINWFGSNTGCGPEITFIIQDYFGWFW